MRIGGEVLPLDITPRARATPGMWKRVPIGPCSFISPFNFPLNLAAHKIAPAHRRGLPVRAQAREPARRSARSSSARCWPRPTCPQGAFSILPCRRDGADLFTDRRAPEAAQLHRLARGRLGPEGARRQEEGRARAGRQRGRASSTQTPTSTTPSSASSSAPSTSRARAASACSASSCTSRSTTTLRDRAGRRARRRSSWATPRTRAPSSAR